MFNLRPMATPRASTTAITTYSGRTLGNVPGTPGFGFGTPLFQPMDWADAARQQRALQNQLQNVQLKGEASEVTAQLIQLLELNRSRGMCLP
ncbi:hypothetical protein JG688_00013951 [Phytophthora aleatoria]|uniref:Uncharacterized protein n=1 Tax=Phytophthora aleatoria TaxID=2496075 RepID=A0A8J5II30_9STRA|nr:hypothetical protein JG688_00013951 [Phytophthora aleatoria]